MANMPSEKIGIGDRVYILTYWKDNVTGIEMLDGDKAEVIGYNEVIGCFEIEFEFEEDFYITYIPHGYLFRR